MNLPGAPFHRPFRRLARRGAGLVGTAAALALLFILPVRAAEQPAVLVLSQGNGRQASLD